MDKEDIKSVFRDAAEAADGLPQHLQESAFEIAASVLIGGIGTLAKHTDKGGGAHGRKHVDGADDHPAVSDLLKGCKSNADKYVVFLHDLEERGESATPSALAQAFKDYKQDPPGNMPRDLKGLAANDWAKQPTRGYGEPWELRSKGRKRYEELVAALHGD